MKTKNLKNIIKHSEEFNPGDDLWNKIAASKQPTYSVETMEINKNKEINKRRYTVGRKKGVLITTAVLCIIAVTIGIVSNTQLARAESTDLMKGIKKSSNIKTQSSLSDNFIKSTSNFSVELFKQTANNPKNKGNVLISPTSMYLALGLTLNGADGETKKVMEGALGKYGLTSSELNTNYKTLMDKLAGKKSDTVVNIANSIWYRQGFNVKKDFLQTNADYFGAAAYELDFNDKNAPNNINSWVKKNTNNLIDKMVDEIDDNSIMYLINTVYFNGKWETPFEAQGTFKGDFKTKSGIVKSDFMSQTNNVKYVQSKEKQAVALPYMDGRFSFLAILPAENTDVKTYLQSFDENTISNTLNEMKNGSIYLSLPKFNMDFEYSMKDELANMGLGNIFSIDEANFSKMADISKGNIFVSKVEQKAYIKVGEKGTEAAAATKVEMMTGCAVRPKAVIEFNRPFIYAIVDNKTGLPVFLGIMENPA